MHILTYLSGIPVEHPAWCNPLTCRIDNEADGGVFVTHQLTLLDDGDRLVDIGQCDSITPTACS